MNVFKIYAIMLIFIMSIKHISFYKKISFLGYIILKYLT